MIESAGGFPLLSLFTFVPLLGMLVILLLPSKRQDIIKTVAAAAAVVPALLGLYLLMTFRDTGAVQYRETYSWIPGLNIYYALGMDGISAPMLLLSGIVGFVAVVASWGIEKQVKGYFALILLLLTGMNGVFCSLDFFLFYVFWELMLLPMYFLIGIWGGPQRVYAAIKFFLYTMAGSVLMLVVLLAAWYWSDGAYSSPEMRDQAKASVLTRRAAAAREWNEAAQAGLLTAAQQCVILDRHGMVERAAADRLLPEALALEAEIQALDVRLAGDPKGLASARSQVLKRVTLQRTFDLMELRERHALFLGTFTLFRFMKPMDFAAVMFIFLFVAFAIKVPVFPFHTWLPWAHVEAPTAISVILAGILLKMGVYGFFRISYSLFPTAAVEFAVPIGVLGVISIIYGACCAMAQDDMKKLVAYSSVSHMGFCMLGLSSLTKWGMTGSALQMFNHGTSTSMMFLLVGVIYDRAHHRDINRFGGLAQALPRYAGVMTLALFASMGLPGLSGFISEALVFLGSFRSALGDFSSPSISFQSLTVISALGVILTAAYLLWMMQRVFFGPLNEKYKDYLDLTGREVFTLVPLGILVIAFGVYPMPLINMTEPSISKLQTFVADSNRCFDGRSGEKTTVEPIPDARPPVHEHEAVGRPVPVEPVADAVNAGAPGAAPKETVVTRTDPKRPLAPSVDPKG